MAIQTLSGSFRTAADGLAGFEIGIKSTANMFDDAIGPSISGRSEGAYIIDSLPIEPNQVVDWMIYGWSIGWAGVLYKNPGEQPTGLLGSLYGGLVRNAQPSITPVTASVWVPWVSPLALPSDLSMIARMWDGSDDPSWQIQNLGLRSAQYPQFIASYVYSMQLPQPLLMSAGDSLGIGMWLTQMILNRDALVTVVDSARWTIAYEEVARR